MQVKSGLIHVQPPKTALGIIMKVLSVLIVLIALTVVDSFRHGSARLSRSGSTTKSRRSTSSAKSMSPLETASTLLPAILRRVPPSEAQGAFIFFFFAGSGALGIGGAQIPKLLKEFQEIGDLAGGPTAGGDTWGLSAVQSLGFKEEVKVQDVRNVLSCFPTVAQIQEKGEGKSYLAQSGFLEREGFQRAVAENMGKLNLPVNPLTVHAVFTALTGGGSSVTCPPSAVYELVPQWKNDESLEQLKSDLGSAQAKKLSAYVFFAFLITLVLDLILESFVNGWFPDYFWG